MRFILLTLLLLSCLSASRVCAQELTPVFENITEGLPSTEVHDIFQDSLGYMWFATDRGICRYNGDEIKTFDTDKDINTNVFFKFFKQTETKVWLLTKNNTLFSYNPFEANPTFHPHPKNDQIETMIRSSLFVRYISDIKFSKNSLIVLFRRSPGYFVIPEKGECYWVDGQNEGFFKLMSISPIISIKYNKEIYYTQLERNPLKIYQTNIIVDGYNVQNIDLSKLRFTSDRGISAMLKSKKGMYILLSDFIFRIYQGKVSFLKLPSRSMCIIENDGKLLVGTFNGIVECNYELTSTKYMIQNVFITKMMIDKDGGFWFSTLQNGIFRSKDISISKLTFPFPFNTTLIISNKNYLHFFDLVRRQTVFFNSEIKMLAKFSEFDCNDEFMGFNNVEILNYLEGATPITASFIDDKSTWKYLFLSRTTNSTYFFTSNNSIFRAKNNIVDHYYHFSDRHQLNFTEKYNDSTLILGTDVGLYALNFKDPSLSRSLIKGSKDIHFFDAESTNNTLLITSNKGIYSYKNDKLQVLFPIPNSKIRFLYQQNENTIWAWSDREIYQIKTINKKAPTKRKFYTTPNGFLISDLKVVNDRLWISTKNGLLSIHLEDYQQKLNHSKFALITDSLFVDNKKRSSLSQFSIYEGQKISIYFNTISYDPEISRDLEYSIDGITWFETNKNSIVVSSFRSGDYILQIRKIDEPSNILFSIPIHVSRVWYQSYWFVVLCSLIILSFVVLLIFRFFKARDQKRAAQLEKLNLELKLLTSKMNPHFTFNTINSIQYYILNSERKEAIQYLSDFALLIRKSLEFSMTERITIEEEIHFLSLYVKLENKRFDSNFHLKFDCEPKHILNKKIPSMVIQPLVENIILHAGYSEEDDKIIQVKIKHEDGFFLIRVIDFGQGIKKENKLNKHKSYGIDILKSRVKMYNGKEYQESDVMIHSTSEGTTVTIKLKEWTQ